MNKFFCALVFLWSHLAIANENVASNRKISRLYCAGNSLCYVYYEGPSLPVKDCVRSNAIFNPNEGMGKVYFSLVSTAIALDKPVTLHFHASNCVVNGSTKSRALTAIQL